MKINTLIAFMLVAVLILMVSARPLLGVKGDSSCSDTPRGLAVAWKPDVPLKWADFQARKKQSKGFALANASCGFGYDVLNESPLKIDLFVRFYCHESWQNRFYQLDEVLSHEQLHFDICEIFGRKFHREMVRLKENNEFNLQNVARIYENLDEAYVVYQDLYDEESDHSSDGDGQRYWEAKVARELDELSAYADYGHFRDS